jgi:acyl-CoA thioesterase FadM
LPCAAWQNVFLSFIRQKAPNMVMLLRVIWMWLNYRRRGRLDVLGTSRLPMRVWPNDLDLNLHMNNGRYFSAADIGRMDWWLRTGIWNRAILRGWRPVAGDANARFSRPMQVFERFELQSRLLGWNEKWFFTEHRFVRDEHVGASVIVRYLFQGKDGKQTPAAILALVGHTAPSPPLPGWLTNWHQAQDQLTATLRTPKP